MKEEREDGCLTETPSREGELFLRNKFEEIMAAGDLSLAVSGLSAPDYFFILRNADREDALLLLEAATSEQWQHVLDLELWERDRLDISRIDRWLSLLNRAAGPKLARWLMDEGADLMLFYFSRVLEVRYEGDGKESDAYSLDYFTVEGSLFVRVKEGSDPDTVRELLKLMAAEDLVTFRRILLEAGAVLPSEQEEHLYRQRNIRLAEWGFLPFEEALEVYSPLDPSVLIEEKSFLPRRLPLAEVQEVDGVSHYPLAVLQKEHQLWEIIKGVEDPVLQERWYGEFAGLANQVYSAQPSSRFDPEKLVRVCREAARLIHLALDHAAGPNRQDAERLLREIPLSVLFRVGYGLVLKIKGRATAWSKDSWFRRQGLPFTFWGEEWGETLKGLHLRRPKYFDPRSPDGPFRDFERIAELGRCEEVLDRVSALDGLFDVLNTTSPLSESLRGHPETECHRLLFHFWARESLGRTPSFNFLDPEEKKGFIRRNHRLIREPAWGRTRFTRSFLRVIAAGGKGPKGSKNPVLEEALAHIWDTFVEEFGWDLERSV